MIRALTAIVVLLATSWTPVSPLLAAARAESNLPACCRGDGQHRCSMKARKRAAAAGPWISPATCAQFPTVFQAPAESLISALAPPPPPFATLESGRLAAVERAERLFSISFDRASQKRGPPVLL